MDANEAMTVIENLADETIQREPYASDWGLAAAHVLNTFHEKHKRAYNALAIHLVQGAVKRLVYEKGRRLREDHWRAIGDFERQHRKGARTRPSKLKEASFGLMDKEDLEEFWQRIGSMPLDNGKKLWNHTGPELRDYAVFMIKHGSTTIARGKAFLAIAEWGLSKPDAPLRTLKIRPEQIAEVRERFAGLWRTKR